ncbi:MAG: hypothetical protein V4581_00630 [Bacteroidota bacterium]
MERQDGKTNEQQTVVPLPDCAIKSNGRVSEAFLQKGIGTFSEACRYIKSLPYGRNADKEAIFGVFDDNCGTCSTKHALLKKLAAENGVALTLVTGIYKMHEGNTPGVGKILSPYGLDYIPEAHNYFRIGAETFDFTFAHNSQTGFNEELLEEVTVTPHEAVALKAQHHKNFLTRWLLANKNINLPLDTLWQIREACIAALSQQQK